MRFGSGWISNDADVDVTSELDLVDSLLFDATKELEKDALLDIKVSIDARCDRLSHFSVEVVLILHVHNCVLLDLGKVVKVLFFIFVLSTHVSLA